MLRKTKGVVFRFTKYGETSLIVTIFTEVYGLQTYIINGIRSKTSRNRMALFQPLTLLDLVVYYRENANINRIKEVRCLYSYQQLASDMKKSAVGMFICEIINKTIKEESQAAELCSFLIESLVSLDVSEKPENFHLIFLIRLSRFLGFGAHQVNQIIRTHTPSEDTQQVVAELLKADYDTVLEMTYVQRREVLDLLVKFYADHIDTLGELKSIQVLREIVR
jgi:DNA repair protein RecO (recombination protein O)